MKGASFVMIQYLDFLIVDELKAEWLDRFQFL